MKKIKCFLLSALLITIFSCSGVEEVDKVPDNIIKDDSGLLIELEWSTGGSVTQSLDEANLNLYLIKDGKEIDASSNYGYYEEVAVEDVYSDGSYIIQLVYYNGEAAVDYTLFVKGSSSTENITFNGSFLSTDKGVVVDYLKIQKSGNEYSIVDL